MPPKRKQPDTDETPARSTRSSARIATSDKPAATTKKAPAKTKPKASSSKAVETIELPHSEEEGNEEPPPKKLKVAAKKPASKAKPAAKKAAATSDETPVKAKSSGSSNAKPFTKSPTTTYDPAPVSKPAKGLALSDEPYSPASALSLFSQYADPDSPQEISNEGFQELCKDAHIPMEGAMPLILSWMLEAKDMGRFTKEEWIKAMVILKISSLPELALAVTDIDKLLIQDLPPIKHTPNAHQSKPYDRTRYWSYTSDKKGAFTKLYLYCFALAKAEQSRSIEMETAMAFWQVLLVPRYPIVGDLVEYITEKGTYKGANKDLWSMVLEFCRTVKPDLSDYEGDGAWPTLLDDFVLWRKSNQNSTPGKAHKKGKGGGGDAQHGHTETAGHGHIAGAEATGATGDSGAAAADAGSGGGGGGGGD